MITNSARLTALIVVTLESDEETRRLVSVAQESVVDMVIIVDCGQNSLLPREFPSHLDSCSVYFCDPRGNIGYGPGSNLGAETAIANGAELLLFANPDIECDRLQLDSLVARCTETRLVVPVLNRPDGRRFSGGKITSSEGAVAIKEHERPTWITTAIFCISSTTWKLVGGFDTEYFIYWDDVDLCFRLKKMGFEIYVASDISIMHVGRGSNDSKTTADFYCFLNCRNRWLFAKKRSLNFVDKASWILGSVNYVRLVSDFSREGSCRRALACIHGTISGLFSFLFGGKWGPPPSRYINRN